MVCYIIRIGGRGFLVLLPGTVAENCQANIHWGRLKGEPPFKFEL